MKKEKLMDLNTNYFLKNENGYVYTGLSAIMIISFMIMMVIILNTVIESNRMNSDGIDSNNFDYIIEDYENNIPVISKSIIGKIANDAVDNYIPCYDSKEMIEKELEIKLSDKNKEMESNHLIAIETDVLSVYNGDDPFHINIKTQIIAKKGNLTYESLIESKVAINDLKDPLPFLMCKNHPTLIENITKIAYKDSLSNYILSNNLEYWENYINASSPLFIKRCPYDPYESHGHGYTLKNCIDNGYYHESSDGSCYLCRLEGKPLCGHYGLETFVVPNKFNIHLNNSERAISASDHVIFSDHYLGNILKFYEINDLYEVIFLDNAHRAKYGLETSP